jgi:peptide/nickel transport system permease protein
MRYIGSRILQSCLLLVAISVFSFIFFALSPGSYFDEMRLNPSMSGKTLVSLRSQYGLTEPLPVRYFRWLRSAGRGEFGFSIAYNVPVAPLLWARARNTLLLTGPATLITWLLALPLGLMSGEKRGGWLDYAGTVTTSALLAAPDLLLALLMVLLAARTCWLPVGGMSSLDAVQQSSWEHCKSVFLHLIGPCLVLSSGSLPAVTRHIRAAVVDAMGTPFVRAARAHGIGRMRILLRHALPVAANPLISLFALSFGSLLSASLLIEVVMSWPGLGPLFLEAILARDFYVVLGTVIFSALFLTVGALFADVLLFLADPRIRAEKLT